MNPTYDAVIIGAGIAGGSLAAALAHRGWRVLLAERRAQPHHKVCGEFLSPESQASFRALGVHADVQRAHPAQMTSARLVSRRGVALRVDLPGTAWGLSRYTLDATLMASARGAGTEVYAGSTVTEVVMTPDGAYNVVLRDGAGATRTVWSRAVVGACGRNPLPKLRSTTPQPPVASTFVGVKCHYTNVALPPEVQIYLFDGGYAGLGVIEDGRVNVCLLVTRDAFARSGSTVDRMIAAARRMNAALDHTLAGGVPVVESACAVAPVDTYGEPAPWSDYPRVGDAVAMIPPLCGDGMAMALRAAELCADTTHSYLAGQTTLLQWRDRYETLWRAEFSGRLRLGRRVQRALSVPLLNDVLLASGGVFPAVAQYLVHATRGRASL